MQKCKNYINDQWIESSSGEVIEVNNPATGKVIGEVSCAKQEEVDMAVDAAPVSYTHLTLPTSIQV